jgi:hypothetical protein
MQTIQRSEQNNDDTATGYYWNAWFSSTANSIQIHERIQEPNVTKRRGPVFGTPASYSGGPKFESRLR